MYVDLVVRQFWILDFGFWIDPTVQFALLGILDFGIRIDSTVYTTFLYFARNDWLVIGW
jgi:hypothetical protein